MVVDCGLKFCLGNGEGLGSNGSKGAVEFCEDLRDRALEEACVVVDKVNQAVGVDGGVDLLNDPSFDVVASVEDCWFYR